MKLLSKVFGNTFPASWLIQNSRGQLFLQVSAERILDGLSLYIALFTVMID